MHFLAVISVKHQEKIDVQPMAEPDVYYTRSGRKVIAPERYGYEKVLAVIKEVYNNKFQNLDYSKQIELWDDESDAISMCHVSKT